MPTRDDILLGQLLLEAKATTPERLEACLVKQQTDPRPIGRILASEGFIDAGQLDRYLSVQKQRLAQRDPNSQLRLSDQLFGQLAWREAFVSEEQLNQALRRQALDEMIGKFTRLGQIFVDLGSLDTRQIQKVLALQKKYILTCSGCGTRYNVVGFGEGHKFTCKKCNAALVARFELGDSDVHSTVGATSQAPSGEQRAAEEARKASSPLEGKDLGPVVLGEKLGQGGMGAVYRGAHKTLGMDVAVKILAPSFVADDTSRQRFKREGVTAARLQHENIVKVYDQGDHEGIYFIVMEFVEGVSAEDVINDGGKFSEEELFEIARSMARALDAARKQGIVHRDIKPGNIFIEGDVDKVYKLGDFGLAKATSATDNISQTGQIIGTPNFMSPEQAQGKDVDFRSDIYSLGATLYMLATGTPPYYGNSSLDVVLKHVHSPLESPHEREPAVSKRVSKIICKMMEKDPARRYAGFDELMNDLEQVAGGKMPQAALEPRRAAPDDGARPRGKKTEDPSRPRRGLGGQRRSAKDESRSGPRRSDRSRSGGKRRISSSSSALLRGRRRVRNNLPVPLIAGTCLLGAAAVVGVLVFAGPRTQEDESGPKRSSRERVALGDLYKRAVIAFEGANYTQTVDLLDRHLQSERRPEVVFLRARALMALGRPSEAIGQLSELLEGQPGHPPYLIERGKCFALENHPTKALADFSDAARKGYFADPSYCLAAARIKTKLGDPLGAYVWIQRASRAGSAGVLQLAGEQRGKAHEFVIGLLRNRNAAGAVSSLEAARKELPGDPWLEYWLAQAHLRTLTPRGALESSRLASALAADRTAPSELRRGSGKLIGILRHGSRRYREALSAFRAFIDSGAWDWEALVYLADTIFRLDSRPGAAQVSIAILMVTRQALPALCPEEIRVEATRRTRELEDRIRRTVQVPPLSLSRAMSAFLDPALRLRSVAPSSMVARAGWKPGWRLVAVDGRPLWWHWQLAERLKSLQSEGRALADFTFQDASGRTRRLRAAFDASGEVPGVAWAQTGRFRVG